MIDWHFYIKLNNVLRHLEYSHPSPFNYPLISIKQIKVTFMQLEFAFFFLPLYYCELISIPWILIFIVFVECPMKCKNNKRQPNGGHTLYIHMFRQTWIKQNVKKTSCRRIKKIGCQFQNTNIIPEEVSFIVLYSTC